MSRRATPSLRWSLAHGPVEDAYVGTTDRGIAEVVPVSTVTQPPTGELEAPAPAVLEALVTGDARALRFDLSGTAFQQGVLRATLTIPVGQVRSYGWVAAQLDRPAAVRAVGSALGRNPVPLLIPCHRVVRSDGQLGQFGFGTEMKRRLLAGEGADVGSLR